MRTFDELESLWTEQPPASRERGTVHLICLRTGNGKHETPQRAELSCERGLHGDRWETDESDELDAQVTLMSYYVAELIANGKPLHTPGDNFLVDLDLSTDAAPTGTRIRLGATVVEVTAEPHMGCKKFAARFGQDALRWINWKGHRERRLRGINCRVVQAGQVSVGDEIAVERPSSVG